MPLDAKTVGDLEAVARLVTLYGVPMVADIVTRIGTSDNPTVADLEALGEHVLGKDPDSYFEDPDTTDTAGGPE